MSRATLLLLLVALTHDRAASAVENIPKPIQKRMIYDRPEQFQFNNLLLCPSTHFIGPINSFCTRDSHCTENRRCCYFVFGPGGQCEFPVAKPKPKPKPTKPTPKPTTTRKIWRLVSETITKVNT